MAQVTLTWHGDREAQAALAGLPDKIERRVIAGALRKVARFLLPKIQAATPVRRVHIQQRRGRGGRLLTISKQQRRQAQRIAIRFARLRNSYKIRAMRGRRRQVVGASIYAGTRAELGIDERGNSYYPAHLEYGFRTRGNRRHIPGRRFMKGPAETHRAAAINLLATEIRAGVEREVRP